MNDFEGELDRRLSEIERQGLSRRIREVASAQGRWIRVEGEDLLNFSSNDYLGLANHPQVKNAAAEAVAVHGAGSGSARLISGSLPPHQRLEQILAAFKGSQAALTFTSGYATALGTISALAGPGDVIILDRLSHACLIDAARLSRAKVRVFRHNDLNDLERILRWAASRGATAPAGRQHTLIVTESVFSMDGDQAPLAAIVDLKEQYGAWLMVDEAHATGLFGPSRRGLVEALQLSERIEVQMGTMGKALGASGGYVCGSHRLVDLLVNCARSFLFSTAPVPAAAAAATAALQIVQSEVGEELRASLWQRISDCATRVPGRGLDTSEPQSAIFPILIGDEPRAVTASARLRQRGIFVPAVRYPAVPRGKARLRVTLSATHTAEDVARLGEALAWATAS